MRRRMNSRILSAFFLLTVFTRPASAQLLNLTDWRSKLDPVLQQRASLLTGQSRVIFRVSSASALAPVTALVGQLGGAIGRSLPIITGAAATIPNAVIAPLAMSPLVVHVSIDRG